MECATVLNVESLRMVMRNAKGAESAALEECGDLGGIRTWIEGPLHSRAIVKIVLPSARGKKLRINRVWPDSLAGP